MTAELTLPLYARIGTTECQIGTITIPADPVEAQVDIKPENVRLLHSLIQPE